MKHLELPALSMLSASRKELDITLQIFEGELPNDIHGYIFLNSPVGNINSNGLPFPTHLPNGEENTDYGSPIFNGDGMVIRLHFNENGLVSLKSRIMKTPCYYADAAMTWDTDYRHKRKFKGFPFKNNGITRMSKVFGVRNQLNTAFLPFRFNENEPARLLVTFDSGRPYEVDTETLELLSPIGYIKEWRTGAPNFLRHIFPVNMTSAHPCFDPKTKEIFIANFIPSYVKMIKGKSIFQAFLRSPAKLERKLEEFADRLDGEQDNDGAEVIEEIKSFFSKAMDFLEDNQVVITSKKIIQHVDDAIDNARGKDPHAGEPNIFLMRWNGGEKWDRFRLVDENGLSVRISQSMHQLSFTEDYIIIMDTSFKMALDLMMTNPFPENAKIDRFIRRLITHPMNTENKTYLIRRADLTTTETDVQLIELKSPMPMECVHFNAEYDNPNDKITFHSSHNNALCVAEWTREYDVTINDKNKPVPKDMIGMYNGAMDVSGIGKFVIDAKKEDFSNQLVKRKMGNTEMIGVDNSKIGANTWSTGLYTYAGLDNPFHNLSKVRYIYWQNLGLDDKMLTDFIRRLYETYPHRIAPIDKIKEWIQKGIPGQIICVDTNTMEIVDYYQLPLKCQNRSIQFMPKRGNELDPTQRAGYLLITVLNPASIENNTYTRELWLFDAEDLSKGPICRLGHPDFDFTYTIHSTWLPEVFSPKEAAFKYNVREDYQPRIERIILPRKQKLVQEFMEQHVYPNVEKDPPIFV